MSDPNRPEGCAPPWRVAIISDAGHRDYDLAFAEAVAPKAEVLFICPDTFAGDDLKRVTPAQIAPQPFPRHRDGFGNLRLLWSMARAIRRFKPDVVHVLSEGQVWLNLLPTLIWPIPMVVTVHDVHIHPGDKDTQRVPRFLVHAFARQARAILVHGETLRHAAIERFGFRPEQVHLGVHPRLDRYRRLGEEAGLQRPLDGVFRVLFFGRIFRYKGVGDLILAEPLIADDVAPRLTIIAGRGETLKDELKHAAPERFDLRARAIPDQEAAQLFCQADLLVLPYIEASQSGVLAIAAACGLPVVATDVGELGALVRRTGMGLVVPPGDPPALAAAISRIGRDPELRKALAEGALAAAQGPLSPEAVWRQVELAYRAAAQR